MDQHQESTCQAAGDPGAKSFTGVPIPFLLPDRLMKGDRVCSLTGVVPHGWLVFPLRGLCYLMGIFICCAVFQHSAMMSDAICQLLVQPSSELCPKLWCHPWVTECAISPLFWSGTGIWEMWLFCSEESAPCRWNQRKGMWVMLRVTLEFCDSSYQTAE